MKKKLTKKQTQAQADECCKVLEVAHDAIHKTMFKAVTSGKHKIGTWRKQNPAFNMMRAEEHLVHRHIGDYITHLEHSLCRIAMALAVRKGER